MIRILRNSLKLFRIKLATQGEGKAFILVYLKKKLVTFFSISFLPIYRAVIFHVNLKRKVDLTSLKAIHTSQINGNTLLSAFYSSYHQRNPETITIQTFPSFFSHLSRKMSYLLSFQGNVIYYSIVQDQYPVRIPVEFFRRPHLLISVNINVSYLCLSYEASIWFFFSLFILLQHITITHSKQFSELCQDGRFFKKSDFL